MAPRFAEIAHFFCKRAGSQWSDPTFIDDGGSAEVYKVVGRRDSLAALKVYDPAFFQGDEGPGEIERIRRQRDLIGVRHPNLVEIVGVDELPGSATWAVTMEFIPHSNLEKNISSVAPSVVRRLLTQLIGAAQFLENLSRPLYHRDIKPANIAFDIDGSKLTLLDLGVIRCPLPDEAASDKPGTKRFLGTIQYSSPEYLVRDESWGTEQEQLRALTFYQIGAVLHDMIMRKPIFADIVATKNKARLIDAVKHQLPKIAAPDVDPLLINIANACLTKDPRQRLARVSWTMLQGEVADGKSALQGLASLRPKTVSTQQVNEAYLKLQRLSKQIGDIAFEGLQEESNAFGIFSTSSHNSLSQFSTTFTLAGQLPDGVGIRLTITVAPVKAVDQAFELFASVSICATNSEFAHAQGRPLATIVGGTFDDGVVLKRQVVESFAVLYSSALARCGQYDGHPIEIREES